MLDPENVRKITSGMIRRVTRTPVTVKCRIGVDDNDSYEELVKFVVAVRSAGVDHVIVHARKCWLKGLSPAANRTIPPLQYGVVHRLSSEFPELEIVLNGGVTTLGEATDHLLRRGEWGGYGGRVCGVMVGRAAYHNPWEFRHTDSVIFGTPDPGDRNPLQMFDGCSSRLRVVDQQMGVVTSGANSPCLVSAVRKVELYGAFFFFFSDECGGG
ncbi:unnamed protein product [Discosporangium mesarthrocarpum]